MQVSRMEDPRWIDTGFSLGMRLPLSGGLGNVVDLLVEKHVIFRTIPSSVLVGSFFRPGSGKGS